MIDFSIEEQAARIHNAKTKEYFEEVRISYSVGNYRSCIVMLYSVVICDLVYKLQDLRDLYKDERAEKILEEIQETQKKNPTSPQWETDLIKKVTDSTDLLELHDKTNIDFLQQHRHLSAHPTLTENNLLFQPSKENARSHIRNMLEALLTKPSIPSKRVLHFILESIAENKKDLTSISEMEKFLKSRFLSNLRETTLKQIFKSFWKLAFLTVNEDCNNHRHINVTALSAIYSLHKTIFIETIKSEQSHYSNIYFVDETITKYIFEFFSRYPEVYDLLSQDTQVLMLNKANNDNYLYLISWFLQSNNTNQYVIDAIKKIKDQPDKLTT